jgi:methyltransferase (TIGR00027 family)
MLRVSEALRGPSRTAVLTAVARALHREEPQPWVIDDHVALELAGPDGLALLDRLRAEVPRHHLRAFSRWVCVRARYPEDLVEQATASGVGQYVILGAGLDSFAYRRRDLLDRLRVFEVDHPASQQWKRQRLAELGMAVPAGLVFAPVRPGLGITGGENTAPGAQTTAGSQPSRNVTSRWHGGMHDSREAL